jgi:RNA polymerase sigma-70 factor (ECF subfamily)
MADQQGDDGPERAQRFRDAALPHLDAVFSLARYLLSNPVDAEDAVQECYLRAYRHFDGLRGPDVKPWLMAILRNVCRAEYARRANASVTAASGVQVDEDAVPLWQEPVDTPEGAALQQLDGETLRALVAALPEPYREAIVLREIDDLSYREIADVVGAPIGTVMSRLARARALLRQAWLAAEPKEPSR